MPTKDLPIKESEQLISSKELDGLIARLDKLETENKELAKLSAPNSNEPGFEEDKEFEGPWTATMRVNEDGRYLIDLKEDKIVFNERTRENDHLYNTWWMSPKDKGDVKEATMDIRDIAKLKSVTVKVLKFIDKKMVYRTGKTTRMTNVDYANYKSTAGQPVPMTVKYLDRQARVELPEGLVFTLRGDRLNM